MTGYWMFSDGHVGAELQASPADAAATLAFYEGSVNLHGFRVFTFWVGPAQPGWDHNVSPGTAELRLDVDYENQRAAVTWLADGTHVNEIDPPATPLVTLDPFTGQDTVPAQVATCSLTSAGVILAEYVATGTRPSAYPWVSAGS
ncbi:Imm1 family immunity protein [Longispora albida]|uniref:Imm1 family immunity protein n=1 Tax=Longispora albida TaxID=203523 RepID=UPI000381BE2C|nr:Imm1 family immunity protein [Longispora albida]